MTDGLRIIRTHPEALTASGGSAFVRYDVPSPLEGDGFTVGRALAIPRRTHTRRLGLLVLGPPDDVDRLFAALVDGDLLDPEVRSVTVQRGSPLAVWVVVVPSAAAKVSIPFAPSVNWSVVPSTKVVMRWRFPFAAKFT